MSGSSQRRPRSLKIQEFYAHSAPINTVHIGRKSSAVLASGGDDQLVNIWRLGKTKPLMSLSGHSTEVDAVLFDSQEALVAAGSRGGSIKVWDLAQGKLIRTLPGHRNSVKCLDFHPYGEYFASGSQDTNVKIFDVRKKGCMQTYKGHSVSVSSVRHSPDGRWIVSGDLNGVVKVWDLTSGKLLQELYAPRGESVTQIDFHPNEFLMAVGGEHGVNFFDMENFSLLSTTPKEASTLRGLTFSKCGRACLTGSSDALRSWIWEPESRCLDSIETVGWGGGLVAAGAGIAAATQTLADMAEGHVPGQELIGVTRTKTVLAIYVCDISSMSPFDQPLQDGSMDQSEGYESLMSTMERVDLSAQQPLPVVAPQNSALAAPHSTTPSRAPSSTGFNPAPSSASSSSAHPPRQSILSNPNTGFFDAQPTNGVSIAVPNKPNPYAKLQQQQQQNEQATGTHVKQGHITSTPAPVSAVPAAAPSASSAAATAPSSSVSPSTAPTTTSPSAPALSATGHRVSQATDMTIHDPAYLTPLQQAANITPAHPSAQTRIEANMLPPSRFQQEQQTSATATSESATRPTTAAAPTATPATTTSSSSQPVPAPTPSPPQPDLSSHRKRVQDEHKVMLTILSTRLQNLQRLAALWSNGDARRSIDELVRLNDLSVSVDFLTAAESTFLQSNILTLELCRDLLPIIKMLLESKYENYAVCGLKYCRMLLIAFTPIIQSCRSTAAVGGGVDLTRDERLARANDCFNTFKLIYDTLIHPIAKRQSTLGELARDVRSHLEKLLWTK